MKKTVTLLSALALATISFAQSPRMVLCEEFTGENCSPCASTNPQIKPYLIQHQNVDMITIKWQVAIPSAPALATSLYQQDKIDIDARYNYFQTGSAPSIRVDGQDPSVAFGAPAASDHAGYISQGLILPAAKAISSPFTIAVQSSYTDATYTTMIVTTTITASQAFTSTGPLNYRLVMTEKEVHYATAPGSNGEKDFEFVVRKAFPDVNGTALTSTWTNGQSTVITQTCNVPSYIWDKTQIEFVGFVEDDGSKEVLQSGMALSIPLPNDAKAESVSGINLVNCATSVTPQIVVQNNGSNAITSMTINPYLGAAAQAIVYWTGSIAPQTSSSIALNPITGLTAGVKTFSANISQVNGGNDVNVNNNKIKQTFNVITAYTAGPVVQSYSTAVFPGANWILVNLDGGSATNTWQRSTSANAFTATPTGCAKYNFYNNANVGDIDELFLPASDLSSISDPILTFDVAKADYLDGSTLLNDQLLVKVSTDCGANWTTVYAKDNTNLSTAPTTTAAFVPTVNQWRSESIDLVAYANAPEVLVKFVTINDYGNNLYIDNVNLRSALATDIKKHTDDFTEMSIFPNPTSNATTIKIVTTNNTNNVNIIITNNIGQIVYENSKSLELGLNEVSIDTKLFASGLYNVTVISKDGYITKKLVVTR